jgi:hypothetical protein
MIFFSENDDVFLVLVSHKAAGLQTSTPNIRSPKGGFSMSGKVNNSDYFNGEKTSSFGSNPSGSVFPESYLLCRGEIPSI